MATEGKLKPELVEIFDDLRKGIVNVPALLQGTPEASLKSLGLEIYEIAPTEPLHDIKGHISNLIEELLKVASGKLLEKLQGISQTVLGRDTIRCSDFRKAIILIVKILNEFSTNRDLTDVFRTAAELTEILYSRESNRTPQTVLRLHNVAFIRHKLCSVVFSNLKTMNRRKMFGRYFHPLTCHAQLLYRLICL